MADRMREFIDSRQKAREGYFLPNKGHLYTLEERSALTSAQDPVPAATMQGESVLEKAARVSAHLKTIPIGTTTRNPLNDSDFDPPPKRRQKR